MKIPYDVKVSALGLFVKECVKIGKRPTEDIKKKYWLSLCVLEDLMEAKHERP